jgi:hypothetical protein
MVEGALSPYQFGDLQCWPLASVIVSTIAAAVIIAITAIAAMIIIIVVGVTTIGQSDNAFGTGIEFRIDGAGGASVSAFYLNIHNICVIML